MIQAWKQFYKYGIYYIGSLRELNILNIGDLASSRELIILNIGVISFFKEVDYIKYWSYWFIGF